MRYERKYRLEQIHPDVVRQVIRNHPASFRKSFPDRQINNIYYDTANLMAYQENVDGISNRRKFRVRWYGEDFSKIENPKLEIKIKENLLGHKQSFSVAPFNLNHLESLNQEVCSFSERKLVLIPTLMNAYQRSYYESLSGKFRLTIDWDLHYFSWLQAQRFSRYTTQDQAVILEIKYDQDQAKEEDDILQYIPFRYSKSSKYVTGLQLCNG